MKCYSFVLAFFLYVACFAPSDGAGRNSIPGLRLQRGRMVLQDKDCAEGIQKDYKELRCAILKDDEPSDAESDTDSDTQSAAETTPASTVENPDQEAAASGSALPTTEPEVGSPEEVQAGVQPPVDLATATSPPASEESTTEPPADPPAVTATEPAAESTVETIATEPGAPAIVQEGAGEQAEEGEGASGGVVASPQAEVAVGGETEVVVVLEPAAEP